MDSNHRSKLQQIYSLSPLATRESAHVFNYDTCIVYHNRCDYASIFFNYSEPPYTFAKPHDTRALSTLRFGPRWTNVHRTFSTTATQLVLLICVGWLYSSHIDNKKICCLHASMTHQLFLFSIVLNSYYFFKLKKTAYDRLPFRRRYFYYGV